MVMAVVNSECNGSSSVCQIIQSWYICAFWISTSRTASPNGGTFLWLFSSAQYTATTLSQVHWTIWGYDPWRPITRLDCASLAGKKNTWYSTARGVSQASGSDTHWALVTNCIGLATVTRFNTMSSSYELDHFDLDHNSAFRCHYRIQLWYSELDFV